MTRTFVVVVLAATLPLACSSDPNGRARRRATAAEEVTERPSPLGLGYPDPPAMLRRALDAAARGAFDEWITYFAFVDENGEIFVPDPATTKGDVQGADEMRVWASWYRLFSDPSVVKEIYGRPRNVRNTPPTIEVPITRVYTFETMTDAKKEALLRGVNAVLPPDRHMTWEQLEKRILSQPRTAALRFVFVDGAWRFDATWRKI